VPNAATITAFIPAVDDGWAILCQPPGVRDLGLHDYWHHSLNRSRRRREHRRPRLVERGSARVGATVAALALGGTVAGAATHADDAAAQTATHSTMLRRGSSGPGVAALQAKLGIPADGIFGPQTQRAVKRYQRAHGLIVDGIVGPQTAGSLGLSLARYQDTTSSSGGSSTARVHMTHAAIREMQSKLGVGVDGVIGPVTRHAISRFEAEHGYPHSYHGWPDAQVLSALGVNAHLESTGTSGSSSPAPSGRGALAAMHVALGEVGVPYSYGGESPSGFDCSGLVQYAFAKAGISLPRTSYSQYAVGVPVSHSNIQAGDLVFFNTAGSGASHVGIATSSTTMVSATSHGVMQTAIFDSYWGAHYVGARRV
jgi:cell wall-associated NlpC family hydrolase